MIDTNSGQAAIRQVVMQEALQALLEPEMLMIENYVDMVPEFSGEEYTDVSVSGVSVYDFVEGGSISYGGTDMGQRTFRINEYVYAGTKISGKFLDDSMYSAQITGQIPQQQSMAIAQRIERDIFKAQRVIQTANSANAVSGYNYRYVAGLEADGTKKLGKITFDDLAYANLLLNAAGFPDQHIGFIPLQQSYDILKTASFLNAATSDKPLFDLLVSGSTMTGMSFFLRIAGFDLYISDYVDVVDETVTLHDGTTSVTATGAGVAMLFANIANFRPIRFGWKRKPTFATGFDEKDKQEMWYNVIARYGVGAGTLKNLVCILCASNPTSTFTEAKAEE